MKTRSYLQRHTPESSDRLTARIQPRPFESSQLDQPQTPGHDFSHVDLFSHAPQRGRIQAKLTVGAANDQYEQEADRVADQVMSMPDSASQQPVQREMAPEEDEQALQTKPLAATITPLIQRDAMPEEEAMPEEQEEPVQAKLIQREAMPEEETMPEEQEEPVQAKLIQREAMPEEETMPEEQEEPVQTKSVLQRSSEAGSPASSNLESQLSSSQGGGTPLPEEVKSFMEPRFGADFSQVRVHTGSAAVQMNRDLHAQAFTHKQDIYFGAGYAPGKNALTAHELTHVVQQTGETTRQPSRDVQRNATLFRKEIQSFQQAYSPEQRGVLQRQLAPNIQQRDPSRTLRRKGGKGAFAPATGRKKTKLKGTYGEFDVEHGLDKLPTEADSGEYHIRIEMTPNAATEGKSINFLQTVRRGTSTGNYSTKATDSGMTKERAERTTAKGWRVDRADPAKDKTPLYGMKKNQSGDIVSRGNAGTGKLGGDKPWMEDTPNVLDPSVMEFVATAIEPAAGTDFGAVSWGFEYDSSAKLYKEKAPALVSAGDPSLADRAEAIKKWNEAVAKPGSGIDQAPDVRPPAPPVGDFPIPSGDTRYA